MRTLSARTGWFHAVAAGIALLLAVFGQGYLPMAAAQAADRPTTVTVTGTADGTASIRVEGTGYTDLPDTSLGKPASGVYAAVIDRTQSLKDVTETSAVGQAWIMPGSIHDGAFATTLQVAPGALSADHNYDVLVWVAHGYANEQTALARVPIQFTQDQMDSLTTRITEQPADVAAGVGTDATFTVAAAGIPKPAVQWESKTGTGDWSTIPGATGTSYTVSKVTSAQSGTQYRAVLTKWERATESAAATLTVTSAPGVPSAPTATVTGTNEVTVHWEAPADGGSPITGYTVTLTPSTGTAQTRTVGPDGNIQNIGTETPYEVQFSVDDSAASYTAVVQALNAKGASPASPASAAASLPSTEVTVSAASTTSMTVHIAGSGYLNLPDGYVTSQLHLGNSGVYVAVLAPDVDPETVTSDSGFVGSAVFVTSSQIENGSFARDIQVPVKSLHRGASYTVLVWAAHGLALPGSVLAHTPCP